jgi:hypothetical protein
MNAANSVGGEMATYTLLRMKVDESEVRRLVCQTLWTHLPVDLVVRWRWLSISVCEDPGCGMQLADLRGGWWMAGSFGGAHTC